jgi:lysophospholipase L1-like esterase
MSLLRKTYKNVIAAATSFKLIVGAVFILMFTNLYSQNNVKNAIDSLRYKQNPNYQLQLDLYDAYKTKKVDIVMLGNSLTHGANWNELLGRSSVTGRGIPSDVLPGFLGRVNSIIKMNPKIVFIMGGLNDIYNWTPVEEIFKNYVRLISILKEKNIIPVIQSTTYATRNYGKEYGGSPEVNKGRNLEAAKLNKMLSDYASKHNIDYIDLIKLFSDRDGYLRQELTWDGIHLKASAYIIWAREVDRVLRKYNL